tara:strand:+ start:210 stop:626 length:417 start_codon:yes stop_codon:yes gene_type:complete
MEEEFYSILKLVSGEEVFSLISIDENDGDPIVILQNPLIMKMIHAPHGMHVKVKPWIDLSTEDFFMIRPDKIITMTETEDKKLIDIYNNFISEEEVDIRIPPNNGGSTKPSSEMGYISSVDDARKNLENLFKIKPKES